MILYLSRHGEASHSGPDSPSSLTPRGQSDVTRMADHLIQKNNFKVSSIWHSPKKRAVQTAEIYRKTFGKPAPPMAEMEFLVPDGDIHRTHEEILAWKGGDLLIVSHLPFLPDLANFLLNGSPAAASISFPTSGIIAMETGKPFKILWSLDPSGLT